MRTITESELAVEVRAAKKRFIDNTMVRPNVIVFPESRMNQIVLLETSLKNTNNLLGNCTTLDGMEVRFAGDTLVVYCMFEKPYTIPDLKAAR